MVMVNAILNYFGQEYITANESRFFFFFFFFDNLISFRRNLRRNCHTVTHCIIHVMHDSNSHLILKYNFDF